MHSDGNPGLGDNGSKAIDIFMLAWSREDSEDESMLTVMKTDKNIKLNANTCLKMRD